MQRRQTLTPMSWKACTLQEPTKLLPQWVRSSGSLVRTSPCRKMSDERCLPPDGGLNAVGTGYEMSTIGLTCRAPDARVVKGLREQKSMSVTKLRHIKRQLRRPAYRVHHALQYYRSLTGPKLAVHKEEVWAVDSPPWVRTLAPLAIHRAKGFWGAERDSIQSRHRTAPAAAPATVLGDAGAHAGAWSRPRRVGPGVPGDRSPWPAREYYV